MTETESNRVRRAVRRLVRAELDAAWKGAVDQIYHVDIEAELKAARIQFARATSPNTTEGEEPHDNSSSISPRPHPAV